MDEDGNQKSKNELRKEKFKIEQVKKKPGEREMEMLYASERAGKMLD